MLLKESSNLQKLRKNTVVVADTGDFECDKFKNFIKIYSN